MRIFISSVAAVLASNGNSMYFKYASELQFPINLITSGGTPLRKENMQPPLRKLWLEK